MGNLKKTTSQRQIGMSGNLAPALSATPYHLMREWQRFYLGVGLIPN
jgi:hypothetical protein